MKTDSLNLTCKYCGNIHETKCPMIKAFEYNSDGTIKRVEFYSPKDYEQTIITNMEVPF